MLGPGSRGGDGLGPQGSRLVCCLGLDASIRVPRGNEMMPFSRALVEPSERRTVGTFLTFACAACVPSRGHTHTHTQIEPLHLSAFRSCKWEWRQGRLHVFIFLR